MPRYFIHRPYSEAHSDAVVWKTIPMNFFSEFYRGDRPYYKTVMPIGT